MKRAAIFMLGICVLMAPIVAQAAIFNVSNPAQFQTALTNAQGNGVADTINVAAGVYNIAATLTYAPPVATESLTIIGAPGAILDGGGARQILNINTRGLADGAASIVINRLTFRNGSVGADGGGMLVQTDAGNITVENCTFTDNTASNDGGGGRLRTTSGAITIVNNTFTNNTATRDAGGMRADAGLVATLSGPMVVTNNFCSGNIAGRDGGCFRVQTDGGAPLTIVNNRLTTNTGGNNQPGDGGGGMRVAAAGTALVSGTLTLTNNTLVNNTMVAGNGGGLRADVLATDTADFFNNIIIDNTAPGVGALGPDIYLNNDAGSLTTLANNNFAGLFSLVPVAVAQANNILASPPGLTADLHLTAGSLCIDAGLNAAHALPAADIDGEARIMGLTGIVDIGADEFFVASPGPPTPVPTGTVISTLTLSANPRVLRAGRTTTVLRGVLSDVNRTRLAGKKIAISVGRKTVKTVRTGANGAYSANIRTLKTRSFSATFAGDATYRPAASKPVKVIVR